MSSHGNSLDARNDRHGPIAPPPFPEASLNTSPRSRSARRIRSQTWDAVSGRLSPIGPALSMKSIKSFDNHSTSGSEGSFRASLTRPGSTKSIIAMLDSASNSYDASYGTPDSSDDETEESKHEEGLDEAVPPVLSPVEESPVNDARGRPKGILRENQGDQNDSRVRFDEENPGKGGLTSSATSIGGSVGSTTSSRPVYSAKLPALTKWYDGDHDNDVFSPVSAASSASGRNAFAHPHHSRPSLLSELNPLRNVSWSLIGACIVRSAPCFWYVRSLIYFDTVVPQTDY